MTLFRRRGEPLATLSLLAVSTTAGCAAPGPTGASRRLRDERAGASPSRDAGHVRSDFDVQERDSPLTPFQSNYLLVYTYNDQLDTSLLERTVPSAEDYRDEEVKFQVSVKFPLWRDALGPRNDLYFGYTQVAWWQLYTSKGRLSSPFRETNYEPEVFLRHYGTAELPFGGELAGFDVGLNHQSNGQSEPLSRSWNRVMGRAMVDYGDLAFLARLWWRLPERDRSDDNPNEYRFLGYGDLRAIWAPNRNTFTALVRPGTEEGGYELTWSYPVSDVLRVYVQWFYGHGESLLDYDQLTNRIGVGLALSDYFTRDGS